MVSFMRRNEKSFTALLKNGRRYMLRLRPTRLMGARSLETGEAVCCT